MLRTLMVALAGGLLCQSTAAADGAAIVRPLGAAQIDWSAGMVVASAGAAADLRMPSADVARPGAERRARAAATAALKAALPDVPLGAGRTPSANAIDAALARAEVVSTDYQSNGGAVVKVGVSFAALVGVEPPDDDDDPVDAAARTTTELVVATSTASLEVRPRFIEGERERRPAYTLFRLGPAPADAAYVKRDRAGRLVLPKGVSGSRLSQKRVIVYVDRVPPAK